MAWLGASRPGSARRDLARYRQGVAGEVLGMPRTSIYVTDSLEKRMKECASKVNWSRVASVAFTNILNRIEHGNLDIQKLADLQRRIGEIESELYGVMGIEG